MRSRKISSGFFVFMAKVGFNGQWVEIARVGKFDDDTGVERDLSTSFMEEVVANYSTADHEAPAVIGHPKSDTPAFGWVSDVRLNDGVLEAKFSDTDDRFEQLVENGRFKKRSANYYIRPAKGSAMKVPNLKHVGFLGAAPPSVKGMPNIQFAEGESFAVESSINFKETEMEEKDLDQVSESIWEKIKAKFGGEPAKPAAETTSFSEADVKSLIKDAVDGVEAKFSEKVDTLTEENKKLQERVDGQVAGGVHAANVAFAEAIPAEKGKHYLKRAGIVEFMDSLAVADEGDADAISFSEGEGDTKVDHKFSRLGWFKQLVGELPEMIQFGEKFGKITATSEADLPLNTERIDVMKDAAGVADGGEK